MSDELEREASFPSSAPPTGRVRLSPLGVLVAELRSILRSEAPLRLHTHALTDREHPDEGGLGPPFTERFMRYIGHWSHWGHSRLGMDTIMEISDWCHARHTSHAIPGSSRSLCAQIVYEACYLGQEPSDLAWLHSLPLEQVESMLLSALRHGRDWRERHEHRVDRHADGTAPARLDDPLPYTRVVRSRLPVVEGA